MTTPVKGAPELDVSQASKEATVNEQVRRAEQGADYYIVADKDLTAPPGACADGACYIVAGSPTGAWSGHAADLAISVGTNASNGWYFIDAREGTRAYLQDENADYRFDGAAWGLYLPGSGVLSLDDLTDVDVSSSPTPTNGDVLTFNSALGRWVPGDPIYHFDLQVAVSDETTAITAGTSKVTFRMPCAVVLQEVRASLTTAQTSGGQVTVDINEGGASILSTKLIFDNGAKTTIGSSPSAVISDAALADNAEITVDIDNIGDGTAKGLKVMLIGRRA